MGYTHYFNISGNSLTKDQVDGIVRNVNKVFKTHNSILWREYDNPIPPTIESTLNLNTKLSVGIYFNGRDFDGHETFAVDTSSAEHSFCKTARKPYDIVVCKVLLILKHYLGDGIKISSDGFSNYIPECKKYKVGDRVLLKDLDGTWGSAARAINRMLKTNFHFIVDDVYGDGGRYFSYKLK